MDTLDPELLSRLRVVDLKVELEKRGLSKSGTKAVLIERLKKFLKEKQQEHEAAQQSELLSPSKQPQIMVIN